MSSKDQEYHAIIVDDDPAIRESLEQWLDLADIHVQTFSSALDALVNIDEHYPGVIVSDVKMPELDGMEFLQRVPADIPFILITGHGGIALAVEAMKAGAYDFVEKPYKPERLVELIKTACRQRQVAMKTQQSHDHLEQLSGIEKDIIGHSSAIKLLRKQVSMLAQVNADVVIHGETGTGKELVAQCLHKYSVRKDHEFVPINVSAIPENLIESELFGHEAGAFTGANKRHVGKFEYANGGTLLLDEIESMPMYFQVKILRVLQEREVTRLGSHKPKALDVRVIAATKKDLKAAAAEGEFREDLYYRLLVSELHIPPLRERKEDIVLLFQHFLNLAAQSNNMTAPDLQLDDQLTLELHDWPGNVRELKNTAERYLLTHNISGISLQELLQVGNKAALTSNPDSSLSQRLEYVEKMLIAEELKHHKGNIKAVMDVLDLPRRTLNQKMQKYDLKREDFLE
ncbi:sigma-54 dependent transcriptional regulator [Reinekea marina]|uniref:Sigma-54-dependent transcriptional regulator n=1 Tax=Reinekea marina TaxID=1310421 RepID=A0ABV7WS56_9GAMM|nr:sigma-54 dependent transcriptional regulator [Reinekea marina]MDN3648066.1 sigma-54 dependent transcriptional regulator [Reinekea marina]